MRELWLCGWGVWGMAISHFIASGKLPNALVIFVDGGFFYLLAGVIFLGVMEPKPASEAGS